MKQPETIKIAHISDLHIGQDSGLELIFEKSINQALHEKILDDLAKAKPDLLFLTGDIANHDIYREENEHRLQELKTFLEKLKSALPEIKIYTVPGNHDFLFNREKHNYLKALDRYYGDEDLIEQEITKILIESSRELGNGPFSKYLEVLSPEPGECNHCHSLSDFYIIKIKGLKLGIITINNSWLTIPSSDDTNNLYLGKEITKSIFDKLEGAQTDFNVMLIHHPEVYNNFRESINFQEIVGIDNGKNAPKEKFGNFFRIKNHSTYIFCGHTHIQGKKNFQEEVLSREPITCECGALHFNIFQGYLRCHFSILHLDAFASRIDGTRWEQFEYSLSGFLQPNKEFDLIDVLNTKGFPDVLKPLYLLKIKVFYSNLVSHLKEEIQKQDIDFEKDVLHNIISYHYELVSKERIFEEKSKNLEVIYITYDDFHKNRSCLVEKYFSEIYYGIEGEPIEYFDMLERYKTLLNVSGMNIFWKIIHHLVIHDLPPLSFFDESVPNTKLKIIVAEYSKHTNQTIDNRHQHLKKNKEEFDSFVKSCSSNFNLDINFEYE
ncbi:MAG: metallophosphoesterase [Saprospiraceae bacterium]